MYICINYTLNLVTHHRHGAKPMQQHCVTEKVGNSSVSIVV